MLGAREELQGSDSFQRAARPHIKGQRGRRGGRSHKVSREDSSPPARDLSHVPAEPSQLLTSGLLLVRSEPHANQPTTTYAFQQSQTSVTVQSVPVTPQGP